MRGSEELKLAVISPYNSECGISTYTESLYPIQSFNPHEIFFFANYDVDDKTRKDQDNVIRNWEIGEGTFQNLIKDIARLKINTVHIQYHSAYYFLPQAVNELISYCKNNSVNVYITFHSLKGPGFDYSKNIPNLKFANLVFVQNDEDYNHLKSKGIKASLFRHPFYESSNFRSDEVRQKLGLEKNFPIIITHGFSHKNKNVDKIIEAVNLLKTEFPDILFLAVCSINKRNLEGSALLETLNNQIKYFGLSKNVVIIDNFLPQEVIDILFRAGHINILAYGEVGEGGSGVIRTSLSSGNPTIVTNIKAFEEFGDEVIKIKDNSPENIAMAVREVVSNNFSKAIVQKALNYVKNNTFLVKSQELKELYLKAL